MRAPRILLLAVICAIVPVGAASFDFPPDATSARPFESWLADLLVEARERGYGDELLARTLGGLQPLPNVLENDRTQPEAKLTFEEYVSRRVTPDAVRRGRELLLTHREVLGEIRDAFGVPPSVIVAIWGLESRFGQSSGDVPVFAALATLAWEARRGAFFRSQLYDALTIVDRGYIDAPSMSGSWAGAMGQPQFMPSSYLAYAVDFDGDGRRDIWTSHADTFASIANYLKSHGWRGDEWGREVRATPATLRRIAKGVGSRDSGCRAMRGMTGVRSLADWRRLGPKRADGRDLPSTPRHARLVRAGTRQFLVYDNYDALLRYNCAHHYALSVALLADRLR
ncbi:MAG: lytic murein transglycosylase [Candidatus Rokubacteria bacterium]|nr:lytic murein transglycosylase [Candidatus Rokubacteria bacterium]